MSFGVSSKVEKCSGSRSKRTICTTGLCVIAFFLSKLQRYLVNDLLVCKDLSKLHQHKGSCCGSHSGAAVSDKRV